jgi:hypothetical protein
MGKEGEMMTPRNVLIVHIPAEPLFMPPRGKGSVFLDGNYIGEGEINMGDFQAAACLCQEQRLALIWEMKEELGPELMGLSTQDAEASCEYALEKLEAMAKKLREVLEDG